jgi:hypothetical protein
VIVICGEYAEASMQIHTETLIAQDEQKPYFLLWGRRGVMCTNPIRAKRTDGCTAGRVSSVHDQIAFNLRNRGTQMEAASMTSVP